MKINKFTYQKPDSDGEIRFDCTAIVENKTDFDIELVRTSIIVVNGYMQCLEAILVVLDKVFLG